jgi:hypothetical protein
VTKGDLQRQGNNQHNRRKDKEVNPPPLLEVGADFSEKALRGDGLGADVLDVAFVGHFLPLYLGRSDFRRPVYDLIWLIFRT